VIAADPVGWDDPDVAALRAAQQSELAALYGAPDPGWDMPGDDILAMVLLRDDGAPVACGALRDASDVAPGTGELKRMFVAPSRRGRGLSRRVLDELERAATAHGVTRLVLETGPLQPAAIGLYLAAGYVPIDRFPPYEDAPMSRAFAKDLTAAPPARGNGSDGVEGLVVDRLAWLDPQAVALRREMAAFLRGLYGATGWFADDETTAATDTAEADRALVVLVVRDGAEPLGTLTLSGAPEARPAGWGELERLLVLPAARGRGVARLLLREAEAEARARGLTTLTLSTGYRQYPAISLYLSSGYRIVAPAGSGWQEQDRLFWFAKAL
jgi:GNAT superfamily N-acetyltransferase